MNKLNIALLSGGISSERDVSIKGGDQVYKALDKNKYNIERYDPKTDIHRIVEDAARIDAAMVILHGPYGEDGTVQGLLDLLHIPYQCTGVLGSSLAMNKIVSKQLYEKSGIPVPPYIIVARNDSIQPNDCAARLGLPLVIKPASGGSSIGMSIVKSAELIPDALDRAFVQDDAVLIEKYIKGTEITGSIIGNEKLQALPLVEIIPGEQHEYFNYTAKYTAGETREICPARIDEAVTQKACAYARMAHAALFCEGYSRTDMIVSKNHVYVLETNTIPGMTEISLLPLAARKAGMDFSQLLDRLIELCMERQKNKGVRSLKG